MTKYIKILLAVFLIATTLQAQNYNLDMIKHLALENNKSLKSSKLEFEAADNVKKKCFY